MYSPAERIAQIAEKYLGEPISDENVYQLYQDINSYLINLQGGGELIYPPKFRIDREGHDLELSPENLQTALIFSGFHPTEYTFLSETLASRNGICYTFSDGNLREVQDEYENSREILNEFTIY